MVSVARESQRGGKALILLLVVVLLSRLPFLGAGYGLHWDAWGNAKIAQQIAETGRYAMARVPGAPAYELTTALFSWGGPWMLNGFSAPGWVGVRRPLCAARAPLSMPRLVARRGGVRFLSRPLCQAV